MKQHLEIGIPSYALFASLWTTAAYLNQRMSCARSYTRAHTFTNEIGSP